MLRLAAPPPQRLEQTGSLDVQIGGAEANVAAACARLGLRTASSLGAPAASHLGRSDGARAAGHGVTAGACCGGHGEPHGHLLPRIRRRDPPPGARARTIARTRRWPGSCSRSEVDWSLVHGARLLHLSGVTAALGREPARGPGRSARRKPQLADVPVSFDVNYRFAPVTPGGSRESLLEILPRAALTSSSVR